MFGVDIDEIEFCKKILPVSKIVLEVSQFDTHLMKDPRLIFENFKHWGYQKGFNYGWASKREAILNRDRYSCQICGKKHTRLEVHHIIYRSNGTPVFHFVNVIDDVDMKITHVIRGEDHLSNTSKHMELYKAFGVQAPKFAHIPLILKTDGPGKMSKRDRGSLVEEYRDKFFLL